MNSSSPPGSTTTPLDGYRSGDYSDAFIRGFLGATTLSILVVQTAASGVKTSSSFLAIITAIEVATYYIESIESAEFLTPAQKRAILHDNAARFLRIGYSQVGEVGGRRPRWRATLRFGLRCSAGCWPSGGLC